MGRELEGGGPAGGTTEDPGPGGTGGSDLLENSPTLRMILMCFRVSSSSDANFYKVNILVNKMNIWLFLGNNE